MRVLMGLWGVFLIASGISAVNDALTLKRRRRAPAEVANEIHEKEEQLADLRAEQRAAESRFVAGEHIE